MIQALLDHSHFESAEYSNYTFKEEVMSTTPVDIQNYNSTIEHNSCVSRKTWFHEHDENGLNHGHEYPACEVYHPAPTVSGTFKAFASIMFAFAGASTFPTIQADMKQKEKFNIAAYIACISKY